MDDDANLMPKKNWVRTFIMIKAGKGVVITPLPFYFKIFQLSNRWMCALLRL